MINDRGPVAVSKMLLGQEETQSSVEANTSGSIKRRRLDLLGMTSDLALFQVNPAKKVKSTPVKRPAISFAESPEIHLLPPTSNTAEEKATTWHVRSDYANILEGIQKDVEYFCLHQEFCEVNGDEHCWRGLEKYLDGNTSKRIRQQTIQALLGHQCFQKAVNKPDVESLAMVSRCFSKPLRDKAIEMAKLDASCVLESETEVDLPAPQPDTSR